MKKSLLFIPDISGFTKFVQNTEVEHSQHVIAELLEVLIKSNTEDLKLAEVEGDALFFYKEEDIPSQEKLLAQVEAMFTAFYSHLKILKENRICPCTACATAPELQLKIVAHCGELQFIEVQGNRKPFGQQVIEAHRLLKNSIDSDNYALISKDLVNEIGLAHDYTSKLYTFNSGADFYDGLNTEYIFSIINKEELSLKPFLESKTVTVEGSPNLSFVHEFNVPSETLLEYISNLKYRHSWTDNVTKIEYDENEVTKKGSQHTCVINEKHFNFTSVVKEAKKGQLVYGEYSTSPPPVDEIYQFYIIEPVSNEKCILTVEIYWKVKSPFKKLMMSLFVKRLFAKTIKNTLQNLFEFSEKQKN